MIVRSNIYSMRQFLFASLLVPAVSFGSFCQDRGDLLWDMLARSQPTHPRMHTRLTEQPLRALHSPPCTGGKCSYRFGRGRIHGVDDGAWR